MAQDYTKRQWTQWLSAEYRIFQNGKHVCTKQVAEMLFYEALELHAARKVPGEKRLWYLGRASYEVEVTSTSFTRALNSAYKELRGDLLRDVVDARRLAEESFGATLSDYKVEWERSCAIFVFFNSSPENGSVSVYRDVDGNMSVLEHPLAVSI